jgi:hypothetical protein
MDDFVVFAHTRYQLKKAIKQIYRILDELLVKVHPDKRYIGRTIKGFDFLGYHISPMRKLLPAVRTLNRLLHHLRQLQEQGASLIERRLYVARWQGWFSGGLRQQVSYPGHLTIIFKQLQTGY